MCCFRFASVMIEQLPYTGIFTAILMTLYYLASCSKRSDSYDQKTAISVIVSDKFHPNIHYCVVKDVQFAQ